MSQKPAQKWDIEAERELWADICLKDFWQFLLEAYGLAHNPNARSFTPRIHKPIARWLEQKGREWLASRNSAEPQSTFLALLIPREFWKTSLVGAWLLWLHLQDTELSSYIGSESLEQSALWFSPPRETMRGRGYGRFVWLYGMWEANDRKWSVAEVVHAARHDTTIKEPSFSTWGVATGLTGTHPDILDLDDPISYDRLEKDSGWYDTVNAHCDSLGPVLKANGLMIWPGTRYSNGDHFGKYFEKLGIREVAGMPLPDHYTNYLRPDGLFQIYFMQARDANKKPVFPEQWPEWRLRKEERLSPLKYAAQLMNDPASSEYNPLTMGQVDTLWIESKHVPFPALRYTIHCDTAFKYPARQARGDESVIVVFGHLPTSGDVYFIEGYGSSVWRAEDFGNKLVSLVQKYRARRWRVAMMTDEQEVGGKGGSWETLLRNYFSHVNLPLPHMLFLNRSGTSKIPRMTTAAGYWVDGHVKLIKDAPGVDQLVKQMVSIGSAGHDDWADAAADVFHKDVYIPMRRVGSPSDDERPSYPGDEWLKTGILTDRDVIKLYDEMDQEASPYEPV